MFRKGVELEGRIIDAIERTIITKEDAENAKEYFSHTTVNEMIDEAIEE